jgi:HEAT repeat protein
LRNSVLVQDLLADRRYLRLRAAAWSFSVLRRDAAPAVPALTRLMNDRRRPEVSERAMVALSCIGEAGFGSLLAGVTNRAFPNRAVAARCIWSIGTFGTNALAAIPVFVHCLKDGDQEVARHAALVLGDITPRCGAAVLALEEALHDPRVPVRAAATASLTKFLNDRRDESVPAPLRTTFDYALRLLTEASKDTDPTVRAIARRALNGLPMALLQLP